VVPRPHDVSAAPRSTPAPRPRELTETDVAEPTAPGSWIRHPLFVALATLACLLPLLVMTAFVLPHARIAEARREAEQARDRAFQAEAAMRQRGNAEEAMRMKIGLQVHDAEKARNEAIEQRDRAKLDAERADKATREMDRRRQEQADLREQAVVAAKVAEQVRDEAVGARKQAEGKLAQLYGGQGLRSMERGELLESFALLAEALRLEHGDAAREASQRTRLAAILMQCPRPLQAWFHDQPVTYAEFSPDGRRVLTVA